MERSEQVSVTDNLFYDYGAELGEGSVGSVYRGNFLVEAVARAVAVKKAKKGGKRSLKRECDLYMRRNLKHPNIGELLFYIENKALMVMPLAERGNLGQVLHDRHTYTHLDWPRRLDIALQILSGLSYLHNLDPPIIHRDLKPDNVLLMDDWTVKIVDFGVSKEQINTLTWGTKNIGTEPYMAPEMFDDEALTTLAVDIYSFGGILFELLTRKRPWFGTRNFKGLVAAGQTPPIPSEEKCSSIKDCPGGYMELMKACWTYDADERPPISLLQQKLCRMKLWLEGSTSSSESSSFSSSSPVSASSLSLSDASPKSLQEDTLRQLPSSNSLSSSSLALSSSNPLQEEKNQLSASSSSLSSSSNQAGGKTLGELNKAPLNQLSASSSSSLSSSSKLFQAEGKECPHKWVNVCTNCLFSGEERHTGPCEFTAFICQYCQKQRLPVEDDTKLQEDERQPNQEEEEEEEEGDSQDSKESKYKMYKYLRVINPTNLEPTPSDFRLKHVLGEGAGSVVYAGMYKGRQVAVKVYKMSQRSSSIPRDMLAEYKVMKLKRGHVNLVEIIGRGAFWQFPHFIVMERASCSLGSALRSNVKVLSWQTRLKIALGIAKGLQHLHSLKPPIVHRDLKSANVMLRDDLTPFLVDFGLAKELDHMSFGTKLVGTHGWMAPELLNDEELTTLAVDVFSFGMVLYELLTDKMPFDELRVVDLPSATRTGRRPKVPSVPAQLEGFVALMQWCWDQKPEERPKIADIMKHLEGTQRDMETVDALSFLPIPPVLLPLILEYLRTTFWNIRSSHMFIVPPDVFTLSTNQRHLYICTQNNLLRSFTFDGKLVGMPSFIRTTLNRPYALDVHQNLIYVMDFANLSVFNLAGNFLLSFPLPHNGMAGSLKVDKTAIYFTIYDKTHEIFVRSNEIAFTAGSNVVVTVHAPTKSYGGQFPSANPGAFNDPHGLTVDRNYLYVCDYNNHRVQILRKESGEFRSQWGRQLNRPFSYPYSIYLVEEDNLFYVGDSLSIQVLSERGEFFQKIATLCPVRGLCVVKNLLFAKSTLPQIDVYRGKGLSKDLW